MTQIQDESVKPTRIQTEIGRLQDMCDTISTVFPQSELAGELANTLVPELERLRAIAKKEVDGEGITSATYNAVASQMAEGHDTGRALYNELPGDNNEAWIICQQFDQIHVLMNETGVENPNPPESHKCFPPGSICH